MHIDDSPNFSLSANFTDINTIIRHLNSAKKPLGMALFLPIVLVISSFITIDKTPYQRHTGILGGPLANAETILSTDNTAMLVSATSPIQLQAEDISPATAGVQQEGMETAMLSGSEQSAKSEKTTQQLPVAPAPESGPDLGGYFSMPAQGFNWGKLHPHNAVDIANACGTSIVASANGMVNEVSLDDWNGGYGHYVLIAHPNGTKTRYAHMEKISVSVGLYVKQGEILGTMGRTGDATGCHVHFEVLGAVNPFAK